MRSQGWKQSCRVFGTDVLRLLGMEWGEPEGRVRRCQIDAAPLSVAFGWLTQYRVLWEDRLARLAKHLEEKKNDK